MDSCDDAESTMWKPTGMSRTFLRFKKRPSAFIRDLAKLWTTPILFPPVLVVLSEDRAGTNGGGDILWIDAIAANLVGRLSN